MSEWESLAMWFDLVKKIVGVELDDHFKVVRSNVQAKGDILDEAMQNFCLREGANLSNISSWYDLKNMSRRMRIKTHLINMLRQHQT